MSSQMPVDQPPDAPGALPEDWLVETGLMSFQPPAAAYSAGENEHPSLPVPTEVCIDDIRPPTRNPGVIGLVRGRALSILGAIATGTPLPPVVVYAAPDGKFRYRMGAGYHRFYISRALGFTAIPAAILNYWEPWMTGDPMQ